MVKVIKNQRIIYSDGLNFKIYNSETKTNIDARVKGKFKQTNQFPLVGDFVDIEINESENQNNLNVITKIYDRNNVFSRPTIANIDNAIIVASLKNPDFDLFLLMKQITLFQSKKIKPIIFFNKKDLLTNDEFEQLKLIFAFLKINQFDFLILDNNKQSQLIEFDHTLIQEKFIVILGQSGAGKSTIINSFNDFYKKDFAPIKTQAISIKLNRGKHTTRHFEAFNFDKFFLVDTPGFSSFDLDIKPLAIAQNFFNFPELSKQCKFSDCKHIHEPGCNVKEVYLETEDSFTKLRFEMYEIYKKILFNLNK